MPALLTVPIREPRSAAALSRTFSQSLSTLDIAEPLCSLDESQPVSIAVDLIRGRSLEALGVRRDGFVAGWVQASDLAGEFLRECARTFEEEQVLDQTAGIAELLMAFKTRERVFIRWLGEISGVITRRDLQKAPLRMWLFGAVTLLDANMTEAIDILHPGYSWHTLVSQGRLEKARTLCAERQRRGTQCSLTDCLQIKDKIDILLSDTAQLQAVGLKSRGDAERLGRKIESLRNHLAHAQELESAHLQTGSELAALIPSIVVAEGVQRLLAARAHRDQAKGP
jgi:hypothetical protein